jgi:putative iron-dependent peroxidase
MSTPQHGILDPVPRLARYLTFALNARPQFHNAFSALRELVDGTAVVAGIGLPLVRAVQGRIDGLRDFPARSGAGIAIPGTPGALWLWLRGDDRGELLHRSRQLCDALAPAFALDEVIDAFQYRDSRDLSGYIDGTENPKAAAALRAAIVAGGALAGSSFVAVQQWLHDLRGFEAMTPDDQDNVFGRRRVENDEIAEAPPSAHVKRTAQESFDPAAFVVRRSMPWADGMRAGLVFTAFGATLDPFEALLNRMVGAEDGIVDALFSFTRPVTGAYYWCPGLLSGRLDLSPLG